MSIVVIGGGPAGLAAAASLASVGEETYLVEKDELGGFPKKHSFHLLAPRLETYEDVIQPLVNEAKSKAKVLEHTEAIDIERKDTKFNVKLSDGKILTAEAVVLTSGFEPLQPETLLEYKAYLYPDVIPSWKLEEMLNPNSPTNGIATRPSDGKRADEIAIVFCAGSRSRTLGVPYCSFVCCGYSCKQVIEIKKSNPEARVHLFYMDIRTIGEEENTLYWVAQEECGAHFVRGRVAGLEKRGDKLIVTAEDTLLNRRVELPVDLVSLDVAVLPSKVVKDFAQKLNLELTENGFAKTSRVVDTNIPGFFVAGMTSGPKLIDMCIAEGLAAAASVANYLKEGKGHGSKC